MYDYPGEYGEQSDGTDYTQIRIEELHSQHEVVHGVSNARGVAVGTRLPWPTLPARDQNRKYLITSASYHLSGRRLRHRRRRNGNERRLDFLPFHGHRLGRSPSGRRGSPPSR